MVATAIHKHGGYALLAALILLMLASLAATAAVSTARVDAQRERELQLLFIGNQFREALSSYAAATGGIGEFPESLQQLLVDERGPKPRYHLRQLWKDPISNGRNWGLVRSQGRIIGVHSTSTATPLKRGNFGESDDFASASTYTEWVFLAREFAQKSPPATGAAVPRQGQQ